MKLYYIKLLLLTVFDTVLCSQFSKLRQNHRAVEISSSDITYLAGLSDPKYTNEVLDNILIPRVVGTENHTKVFNYIKGELEKLKWDVDIDEFEDETPFGRLTFRNIIGTLNPNAERFLVLACHYDSKYFDKVEFVGATDSAVPCAMMLNLAKVMNNHLASLRENTTISLKLLFFDGEEAFVNWGPTDSIYGARHLAAKYHKNRELSRSVGETVSDLERMDMLVLLDLIGQKGTSFKSYFRETQNWFLVLADAEDKLNNLGLLKKHKQNRNHVYFTRMAAYGYIEDDHIPFWKRNVPILHLISSPFPREWHTPADNRDLIDMTTVENINKILRVFVAEYLHMSVTKY